MFRHSDTDWPGENPEADVWIDSVEVMLHVE
jgi:hypothetical protein